MTGTLPRIAIIGAGPAGLMLASILHHNEIPSTVFERDSSAVARAQGGSLDIHGYSGQQALRAAGLLNAFRAAMRPSGEAMKLMKQDGTILFEASGKQEDESTEKNSEKQFPETADELVKGRPEIDRSVLKDILIASLPDDTVRWGSKVAAVVPIEGSKRWTVELEHGPHPEPFDLVVGADGGWSRTRALLTKQQPIYSGITALDVWLRNVDEVAPDVSAFVGLGNCFIFAKDHAMLFQRNGTDTVSDARCYACVKTDPQATLGGRALLGLTGDEGDVDWTDAATRERFVEKYFADWFDEAKRIFLKMAEETTLRPLYMLPVGFTWDSQPGVTLVGDAAHLMTPFAGVGVNVALMDSLELAQGIIGCVNTNKANGDSLAAMLKDYEKGMFARSSKEAAKTNASLQLRFEEDGAERMAEIMANASQPEDIRFE
ncbi:hypothetical protein F4777DRAFT_384602 [Nemania sp. FL0916]|nr:hypothetical protein F4777DRAFT_384602 [Nemania sp. FL0916]